MLVQKMHEVSDIVPQSVGVFTPVYRRIIPYVKYAPWRVLIVGSMCTTLLIYLVLGSAIVRVVSILQHGF